MLRRSYCAEANLSQKEDMTSQRHHNVYEDGAVCFWTSSVVGFALVLSSPTAARTILAIWDDCRRKYDVKLLGYVIMPNHIHLAVWSERSEDVRKFITHSLRRSSGAVVAMTRRAAAKGDERTLAWLKLFESNAGNGSNAALWKERGRAFPVTTGDGFQQKLRYIHENPVRLGLVAKPEDWQFSSASWYADGSGPLVVDTVDIW